MSQSRVPLFVVTLVGLVCVVQRGSADESSVSDYLERRLELPELGPDGQCPVSVGDSSLVSSDHGYVFGAGGYFYGTGPVYLALTWKPADRAEAFFDLDPVPRVSDGYRLKTPWVMDPNYQGKALVRGAQIGTDSAQEILFGENTQSKPITASMILRWNVPGTIRLQEPAVDAAWGFWPSSMVLPEPGCYGFQIDTESRSDVVVFEARLSQ